MMLFRPCFEKVLVLYYYYTYHHPNNSIDKGSKHPLTTMSSIDEDELNSEKERKAYYGIYEADNDKDNNVKDDENPFVSSSSSSKVAVPPRQDCQCCDSCWACIVTYCCCCGGGGTSRASSTSRMVIVEQRHKTKALIYGIVCFLYWAIVWSFASSFPTTSQFDLLPGETWEIALPPLWSRSNFGVVASSAVPLGVQVYEFAPTLIEEHAQCPLPTPQNPKVYKETKQVTLHDDQEVSSQYTYDSFHLNAGSHLTVDVQQDTGACNIYLLQGYGQWKQLQQADRGDGTHFHDFRATSILKRYSAEGGRTTFTYPVPNDQSDFYMVVYENASTTTSVPSASAASSHMTIRLHVDMTKHLLPKGRELCNVQDTYDGGCFWELRTPEDRRRVSSSCLIVKAVLHDPTATHDDDTAVAAVDDTTTTTTTTSGGDSSSDDHRRVQVQLVSKIGSKTLIWAMSLPIWIFLLLLLWGDSKFRNPTSSSSASSWASSWHLFSKPSYETID